jgi:hypothetical protein
MITTTTYPDRYKTRINVPIHEDLIDNTIPCNSYQKVYIMSKVGLWYS